MFKSMSFHLSRHMLLQGKIEEIGIGRRGAQSKRKNGRRQEKTENVIIKQQYDTD